jgi:hypothetical protein
MTIIKQYDIRNKIKELAIGTVALLTMTVPMLSTAAAQTDEVLQIVGVTPLSSLVWDVSFIDPTLRLYLLADRTNAAIDVLPTGSTTPTLTTLGANAFVGSTGAENTSGPNGVITVNNHTEVWAGDGPATDAITGLSTSHVVVIDIASNTVTQKIDTGGVTRADKLCEDPKDNVVLVANDGPNDRFLTFISTNRHKVIGKIKLDGSDPNGASVSATNATSAITQCQWDSSTGSFYIAVPEVGGLGDNSVPGAVLVIDPKKMKVQHVFAVDHTQCVGPQGLTIGPNPQILLGCTGVGIPSSGTLAAPYALPLSVTAPGSVIISAIDGSRLFSLPGVNGVDEVWYNSTNNSYFFAAPNYTEDLGGTAITLAKIGVIDAGTPPDQTGQLDQLFSSGGPFDDSIAVDPNTKTVYLPSRGALCGNVNTSACIVLWQPSGTDDPGVVVGKK